MNRRDQGILSVRNLQRLSLDTIMKMNVTKEELFKDARFDFDYSLPQEWLNAFSNQLKKLPQTKRLTYDVIRSTTVWLEMDGFTFGRPVSICKEVHNAICANCDNYYHGLDTITVRGLVEFIDGLGYLLVGDDAVQDLVEQLEETFVGYKLIK